MVSQYITKWWIIGCPLGRKTPIYKERRKRALQRLKQRKKNKVLTYYFCGIGAAAALFFVSDILISMAGGGGAWQLLEMFVKRLAGT